MRLEGSVRSSRGVRAARAIIAAALSRRVPPREGRRPATTLALGVAILLAACGDPRGDTRTEDGSPGSALGSSVRSIATPAGDGALGPNLAARGEHAILSWLEPCESGGHRLRAASLPPAGERFEPAVTITEGDSFFANWADVPALVAGPGDSLTAHWLEKIGAGTYAYGVALATSDDGSEWTAAGWLHDDQSHTEHGFTSYARTPDGIEAFWLDGREMTVPGGAMSLRVRDLAMPVGDSRVLDDRVCECCQTDAAMTARGPIVVYRDRSPDEIRDISRVFRRDGVWSEPAPVANDGWQIGGCPVNGPALAADGDDVAVAWFTAADDRPRVQLSWSRDAGDSFGPPLLVDDQEPVGRVDVAVRGPRAWVSWIGRSEAGAALSILEVRRRDGGLERGDLEVVSETSAARSAGFPRLLLQGDRLLVAWIETGEPARLRVATIPLERS